MIPREILRLPFSWLGRKLVPYLGTEIVDCKSDEVLGRAFLVCWAGCFYVFAYNGQKPLLLVWLAEDKVRYWRSRIGFTSYSGGADEE